MTFCKTALLFSLFFSLTNGVFAQTTKPAALQLNLTSNKQTVDHAILEIRQHVQKINSKKLKKEHYTYESAGCTEDGVVDYYFDEKAIVKVIESGAIGDGSWVNEYYYQSGKVIFCFQTIVGGPAIGKVTKTEYRFYVKDDSPLKIMEGAKTVKSDSKATEFIGTANRIFKAYASKDFAGALCN